MYIFRNKKIKISLTVLIILALIVFVSSIYIKHSLKHPFKSTANNEFEVKKGDNFYSIIERLKAQGRLNNALISKAYIKYKNVPGKIKPGIYLLSNDISMSDFVHNLNNGIFDGNYVKVTIPEGFTLTQIGDRLQQKGIISSSDFIKACNSYSLPSYIKKDSKRKYQLEGFLFPDTYQIKKGESGSDIIKLMLDRFELAMKNIEKKDDVTVDESKYDNIINVASLVEKEAYRDQDRAVIASVFYNRLKKNMKLQSNVTVEYALGYHKEKLYNKDIAVASPYNTYYVNGLPEGPICSPGTKSIEAAINPSKTNYLYFLSYENGISYFTDNYNKFLVEKKKLQGD